MVWENGKVKKAANSIIAEGTTLSKSKVIVCIGYGSCFNVAAARSSMMKMRLER